MTFFPEIAKTPARLEATKVLPSPPTVEVTEITWLSLFFSFKKVRFVLNDLKDSLIADLGLSKPITWNTSF